MQLRKSATKCVRRQIQISFTLTQLNNKCSTVSISIWQNEQVWLLTLFILYNLFVDINLIMIGIVNL